MPEDQLLQGVPERVVRVQRALAAASRLVILRQLLEGPLTFVELSKRVAVSETALRAGLAELAELGYVSDDSPEGRQRKAAIARYRVDRDMVLRDAAELLVFLAR